MFALALVVTAVVALSGPPAVEDEETTSQQAVLAKYMVSEAPAEEKREFDPGQKLEIDEPEPTSEETQPESRPRKPVAEPAPETLPVAPGASRPVPSGKEVTAAEAPRYYPRRQNGMITLTMEGRGLYDVPVINANTQEALDVGVIHFPQTPMPWEERDQKNVYLAGHRLGWEGTGSRLVFYNLDKLKEGDLVILQDSLSEAYLYRVSEVFVVEPEADWVVDPVRGRDMVTLQTCTFPDLLNRLIVRADRV